MDKEKMDEEIEGLIIIFYHQNRFFLVQIFCVSKEMSNNYDPIHVPEPTKRWRKEVQALEESRKER